MAKEAGLTTSFDAQWDPSEKWELDYRNILPYVDIFLPNDKELLALTGKKTIKTAIESLKDAANVIAVKLGDKGSIAVCDGKIIFKEAFLLQSLLI